MALLSTLAALCCLLHVSMCLCRYRSRQIQTHDVCVQRHVHIHIGCDIALVNNYLWTKYQVICCILQFIRPLRINQFCEKSDMLILSLVLHKNIRQSLKMLSGGDYLSHALMCLHLYKSIVQTNTKTWCVCVKRYTYTYWMWHSTVKQLSMDKISSNFVVFYIFRKPLQLPSCVKNLIHWFCYRFLH